MMKEAEREMAVLFPVAFKSQHKEKTLSSAPGSKC